MTSTHSNFKYKYYFLNKYTYMAAVNGMHGSEALQNDIFGDSPRMVGLSEEVQKMLQQFSPEQTRSPAVSERINRISAIADALESVA